MDAFDVKRQRDLKREHQNKVSKEAIEALKGKIYIELHEYPVKDYDDEDIKKEDRSKYNEGYMLATKTGEVSSLSQMALSLTLFC